MRKIAIFLLFLFTAISGFSQGNAVQGKVTGENGNPLEGVTIQVKGNSKGFQTNRIGTFNIPVSGKDKVILVFSFIGYESLTLAAVPGSTVAVALQKQDANLEDVVVVGYQTVRRKDLLASVASIGAKDLKDIPINSAAEALNGRLAGVTATTAEGSPDADVRIRIRGGMSITGSNEPLYVIDGIQVENGLSTISPQDIQNIDVLKDAAATAIYGARGANGVIIITTKSGRPGPAIVNYNGFVGVKNLANKLDVLSPYDFVLYQLERSRSQGGQDSLNFLKNFGSTWDTLSVYKKLNPVDWQDEVFGRTGMLSTHNVNVSGGSKKLVYSFGYTNNSDKAIVLNSNYKRNLLNLKMDYKLAKNLKLGLITRYTLQNVMGAGVSSDAGTSLNRLRNTIRYRPFLSNAQDIDDNDPFNEASVGNGLILVNPISLANAEYKKKTTEAYNVTVNAQYTIVKNLSFKSTFGYDRNKRTDRQFYDTIAPLSIQNGRKPIVALDTTEAQILTNSNVLNYSLKNWKKHHDLDIMLGEETYDLRTSSQTTQVRDYPVGTTTDNALKQLSLGTVVTGFPRYYESRFTQLSFFGRVSYSYKDKLLFSANMRRDGASKFAPENRWGTFPAASLAWRIKNAQTAKNTNVIGDMKLRLGYGVMGNNRIRDYLYQTIFTGNGSRYYGLNGQPLIAYVPASLPNQLLKWESTENRNIGMDVSLFKKRIDLTFDYYINSSRDLLLNVNIDPTYGFTTQQQNVGKTSNKGYEIQLNTVILNKPQGIRWNANFNISHNRNEVVQLGPGQTETYPAASWGVSGQPTDYILRIGQRLGAMWGLVTDGFYSVYDFNYNPTTKVYTLKTTVPNNSAIIGTVMPGSIKFKDLNGDGKVDLNNDRTIIGNPNPKFTGGLAQQFAYKQWDLNLFVNFMVGFDVYNANKIELTNAYSLNSNMLNVMKNRWTTVLPNGDNATLVRGGLVYGIAPDQLIQLNEGATIWQPLVSTGAFIPHSWAIEDGSFLRINNLTLGYTLPIKRAASLKINKLRVYATANNLAIFTNYSGYDPEVSVRTDARTPNLDYSAYPKSRSFIFGINASF